MLKRTIDSDCTWKVIDSTSERKGGRQDMRRKIEREETKVENGQEVWDLRMEGMNG